MDWKFINFMQASQISATIPKFYNFQKIFKENLDLYKLYN